MGGVEHDLAITHAEDRGDEGLVGSAAAAPAPPISTS